MRINKYISSTGFCSRREADKLINEGRVTINGSIAELGSTVEASDKVCVDNTPVCNKQTPVYIALNKPVGITCTTESQIEGNIVDYVNHPQRIFHIGRLDKDSEGLILLTNDGDIVNKILRVENNHEKEYIVTVDKPLTQTFLEGMENGVLLEGKLTKKCTTKKLSTFSFSIILTEGRFRQIRRMCAHFDFHVKKLQRIRIMHISLEGIEYGKWRDLTKSELSQLFNKLDYHPFEI